MSIEDVRNASAQFYAALNRMLNGDAKPLAEIWSHSAEVTTMHPIGGREVGWAAVWQSWDQVGHLSTKGQVRLDDQILRVVGDIAYEVGVERGSATMAGLHVTNIEDRVTNVYRREAAGWRIVHHHTDISQQLLDIIKRVKDGG